MAKVQIKDLKTGKIQNVLKRDADILVKLKKAEYYSPEKKKRVDEAQENPENRPSTAPAKPKETTTKPPKETKPQANKPRRQYNRRDMTAEE